MPSFSDDDITPIGRVDFRNDRRIFGIRRADRRHHIYIVGRTGTGKSTLMGQMAWSDIRKGEGVCVLDPHGDLVERLYGQIPEAAREDVLYWNVAEDEKIGINPIEPVPRPSLGLASTGLIDVFRKLFSEFWGPRSEHLLRNAVLALMEQPENRFSDLLRIFHDKKFQAEVIARVSNPVVRDFWLAEWPGYPARLRAEAVAPLQNKTSAFLADPILARIFSQPKTTIRFRQTMDQRKVVLINLSKGRIGEASTTLLGSLLLHRIGLAGMTRTDMPEGSRADFYVHVDEAQSFMTPALGSLLSELRKYRVSLAMANQFLGQLAPDLRSAVLGNAGSLVVFRLGLEDAEILGREFAPESSESDLLNLDHHHFLIRLMTNGSVSRPFSAAW